MKIQNGASGFVLTPKEKSPDGAVRASVGVSTAGFTGANRKVWLSPFALSTFLKELRAVCDRRTGEATLEALSPEEFRLCIRITDLSGHASCFVDLAQLHPTYGRWTKNSLSVEFELDPSLLPKYVADAERITQYEPKPA
jgi:hypothetical protein